MKKLIRLLLLLFIFYILIQGIFNIFSKGYEINYRLDDYSVYEKRIKHIKGEEDNYYFEISNGTKVFSIQTNKNIASSEKVIKEIKTFKDDNYECVFPIVKGDIAISDIMCETNGKYYYYNSLQGKDSELDSFAETLAKYRENYNQSSQILKTDSNVTAYDNFEEGFIVALEYYKGVYIFSSQYGYISNQLFTRDIYTKDISAFVNGNYLVADYSEDFEFNKFYVVNLKTKKQTTITSDRKISMYSYVQGVVGNSAYIIDTANLVQYEVNIKTNTVTITGGENGIKIYRNGEWIEGNIHDAINNKIYFDTITTEFNGKEYARVDKTGGEKSGYYYLYEKNGDKYDAYRVNVQNPDNLVYLFQTDNIDKMVYDGEYVFYKDAIYLKYFSSQSGSKTLVKYGEVDFNSSLKFSMIR